MVEYQTKVWGIGFRVPNPLIRDNEFIQNSYQQYNIS